MRTLALLLFCFWSQLAFAQIGQDSHAPTNPSPAALYNQAVELENSGQEPQALYFYRLAAVDLREARGAQARLERALGLDVSFHLPLLKSELFAASFGLFLLGVLLLLAHKKTPNIKVKNWALGTVAVGFLLLLPLLPFQTTKRLQVMESTASYSGPGSSFYQIGEVKAGQIVTVKRNLSGWLQVSLSQWEFNSESFWLPESAVKGL